MNKEEIYQATLSNLKSKIASLKVILEDSFGAAASNDAKSSAGDKHETGVAMAHLEQEKITKQVNELLLQQELLLKINPSISHSKIGIGSLVKTNKGWFYFSIGLGAIEIANETVFAINPKAPLGQLLVGKTVNESVKFNGATTEILQIL
ncbi:MAG: hypothetical protein EBQ94_01470 [Flavobacteriales bacterium]|nr:hypothetical protein [Flavobacteriales bacterium]NCA19594.1 hypothetical protein [Crocinitomicaceae bacterium]